jgi:hypothetical protein
LYHYVDGAEQREALNLARKAQMTGETFSPSALLPTELLDFTACKHRMPFS